MTSAVLQVSDLRVTYYTDSGRTRAVDGGPLKRYAGERLGLVGESGCGKSTMALALMRMIKPPGRIESGSAIVGDETDNVDMLKLNEEQVLQARLSRIAYIPQGAMNSLNPVMRIGVQMIDAIQAHRPKATKTEMREQAEAALESVELKRGVFHMYAHELSGGMKQRVCIAIGILLSPKVIIADEPTSALDVVVQRQVMETICKVQEKIGATVILIGHDMGLMCQITNRVAVMYAGKLVELSTVREMFTNPMHPYAKALIASLPNLDNKGVFRGIPGLAPSLLKLPSGCVFHPRCQYAMDVCKTTMPQQSVTKSGRYVYCHLYDKDGNQVSGTPLIKPEAVTN